MHEFKQRCYAKDVNTIVKNSGKENIEIITKEGNKINKYTLSKEQTSGSKGRKVGIAYELENG